MLTQLYRSEIFLLLFSSAVVMIISEKLPNKAVPLHVVTLTVGDNIVYGKNTTEFSYNIGFSHAKALYPRVFQKFKRTLFYIPGNYSCAAAGDEMTSLVGRVFERTSFGPDGISAATIILAPGCSLEIGVLGDFARDPAFMNKHRFPTVVTTACSNYYPMTVAVIALLRRFTLAKVTMICDKRSLDVELNTATLLACSTAVDLFYHAKEEIHFQQLYVDSSLHINFQNTLLSARRFGSVIMLVCLPEIRNLLMAAAMDLELQKKNVVFIIFSIAELPLYGNVWTSSEPTIKKAARLLPYCIQIVPSQSQLPALYRHWVNISEAPGVTNSYMRNVAPEFKINAVQIAAYETFMMMAQVLDKSYSDLPTIGTGANFAKLFQNRSFTVAAHRIDISAWGTRLNSIDINLYNQTTDTFEKLWHFDAERQKLEESSNDTNEIFQTWLRLVAVDPCELEPANCVGDNRLFALVSIVCAVVGITATSVGMRYKRIAHKRENSWWFIDDYELNYEAIGPGKNYVLYLAGHNVTHLVVNENSKNSLTEEAFYKSQFVEIIRMEFLMDLDNILKRKKTLATLKILRVLVHPNIATFYGLSIHKHPLGDQLVIVVESPKKGLLRNLIDDDSLIFNWDLRYSLIWDIIKALRYLHSTPMKCHGFLCFINFIIDQHFTLKIAHTGLTSLFSSFFDKDIAFPVPPLLYLWCAPEVINDPLRGLTRPADIYSLGVVLYEMVTRSTPFDVDVISLSNINQTLDQIRTGKLDTRLFPMPNVSPLLIKLINKCWSLSPDERPTMAEVSNILIRIHPHYNLSFTENLIYRLQDYNEELERQIGARTEALLEEQLKVDALLSSLLPASIVLQLRLSDKIIPEYFESVSVLFSVIPAFNEIVAACSPFVVVELLQTLYSSLDDLITQHDVYKVETVKDSYMVASGLPERNAGRHVSEISLLSLKMLQQASLIQTPASEFLKLRIGICSGPCMAAVIGQKLPHYCLVGDTVNTASRMESYGEELKIQVSLSTKVLLDNFDLFEIESRGVISVKGKGEIPTFWLLKVKSE